MQKHPVEDLGELHEQKDGKYYDVNFFSYQPLTPRRDALPSSYILMRILETLHLDESIGIHALRIRRQMGINTTLWGLRKEPCGYSVEYYFFYPKKFPNNNIYKVSDLAEIPFSSSQLLQLESDDCYLVSYNVGAGPINKLNIYKPVIRVNEPIITMGDTGFFFNRYDPVFHSYEIAPGSAHPVLSNTYYTFFGIKQLYDILQKTYSICRVLFPGENEQSANEFMKLPYLFQDGYMIHSSAVTRKNGAVGLYFNGLFFNNFILFMKYHDYDPGLIATLEHDAERLSHMRYDVGIDFYLESGKFEIKKTAFWGSF